jgi:hypothetical protein
MILKMGHLYGMMKIVRYGVKELHSDVWLCLFGAFFALCLLVTDAPTSYFFFVF